MDIQGSLCVSNLTVKCIKIGLEVPLLTYGIKFAKFKCNLFGVSILYRQKCTISY